MQHGGRGDALLGLDAGGGDALQEAEVLQEGVIVREVQFVHDPDGLRLGLEALKGHGEVLRLDLLSAGQPPEKVQVPEGAAVLAVGDGHKTVLLFFSHKIGDFTVFHGREFITGDDAGRKISAGSFDGVGSQEAADHVGTVRRINAAHVTGSHFCVYRASGTKKAGQDG